MTELESPSGPFSDKWAKARGEADYAARLKARLREIHISIEQTEANLRELRSVEDRLAMSWRRAVQDAQSSFWDAAEDPTAQEATK